MRKLERKIELADGPLMELSFMCLTKVLGEDRAYPIHWQAVKFRGLALLSAPLSVPQPLINNALLATIILNPFMIIPYNKVSNNLDYIRKDLKPI